MLPLLLLAGGAVVAVAMAAASSRPTSGRLPPAAVRDVAPGVPAFAPAPPPAGFELAPNGLPVVLYRSRGVDDKGLASFGGYGLDAGGTWWMNLGGGHVARITPTDGTGVIDTISNAVIHYVVPALAAVLGTTVGGPVGLAAAFALTTWGQLARGVSIKDAFAETLRQTPGIVDRATIQQTFDAIQTKGLTLASLAAMRAALPHDLDTLRAFDVGVALGKAAQVQGLLVPAVASRLPASLRDGFSTALANGARVRDFVAANFGAKGLLQLDTLTDAATSTVANAIR